VCVDYFTLGIFKFAKLGFNIGKSLGGLLGPLAGVIGIFEGLPSLWQKLTSGDLRTAIKGALALITQITASTLATIFGGPVGGIAAAMTLNFERIYRWFEPLFDLMLDVGETIFDLISSIYTDFVQPVLETVTEVIVKLLDGAFTLLAPVLKLLRMVFTVMSYTIFPLVKLAFSALGFVFKYTFKALMFVYENTIEPVINGIAYVFNLVLDTINDVVKKVVEYAIGWYNDTLGNVFGKKENPFDTAKAAVTAVATKTTEITKEKAEDTKEWFGSLSESVTEGVSDAMSTGQQLGGSASESLNSLVEALKQHTEAVKDQTVALSNSPLGMKIKEKGTEALDYMLTPMSNQMQYVASPSASLLSQQEMMNSALGYKGKAGDTIVNNVVNNTSGSNGGGGMIPMISSGHMDPTKVALQISYRPPG
jgi:phage-related protein